MSYLTGQIAHDLNNLQVEMGRSPALGKFIDELPAVHSLMAQLKAAKFGTPSHFRKWSEMQAYTENNLSR